jgi:hypothetical protein
MLPLKVTYSALFRFPCPFLGCCTYIQQTYSSIQQRGSFVEMKSPGLCCAVKQKRIDDHLHIYSYNYNPVQQACATQAAHGMARHAGDTVLLGVYHIVIVQCSAKGKDDDDERRMQVDRAHRPPQGAGCRVLS